MKRLRTVLIMLLCCSIFVLTSSGLRASADFGNFSNYDSGGNWDFGDSDYDSSWGDDWDFDSNYDDSDYDSDYSSSPGSFSWGIIVFIIVIVIIIKSNSSKNKSSTKTVNQGNASRQPIAKLPDKTAEIAAQIKQQDPSFASDDFITFAKYVFVEIQDAWSKQDLRPVAGILHQNLYQMTQTQIDRKKADGIINCIERISVTEAYLTDYTEDDRFEYLTVYLCAQMTDYQIKADTGAVVLGDKNIRYINHYSLKFLRTQGTKTVNTNGTYDLSLHCPHCGAEVNGTSFGVCEYCGSTVTNNQYTWVLTDILPVR